MSDEIERFHSESCHNIMVCRAEDVDKLEAELQRLRDEVERLEGITKRLQPETEYSLGGFTGTGTFMCVLMTNDEAKEFSND